MREGVALQWLRVVTKQAPGGLAAWRWGSIRANAPRIRAQLALECAARRRRAAASGGAVCWLQVLVVCSAGASTWAADARFGCVRVVATCVQVSSIEAGEALDKLEAHGRQAMVVHVVALTRRQDGRHASSF